MSPSGGGLASRDLSLVWAFGRTRHPFERRLFNGHQVGERDRFVAMWAEATGPNPAAGPLAVRAPLFPQVARLAGATLVNGGQPGCTAGQWWHRCGMALAPRGLAADLRAEPPPARRDEGPPTPLTGYRYAIVTRRAFSQREPPATPTRVPADAGDGCATSPSSRRTISWSSNSQGDPQQLEDTPLQSGWLREHVEGSLGAGPARDHPVLDQRGQVGQQGAEALNR